MCEKLPADEYEVGPGWWAADAPPEGAALLESAALPEGTAPPERAALCEGSALPVSAALPEGAAALAGAVPMGVAHASAAS